MGVLYTLSIFGSECVFAFLKYAWIPVLILAGLMLPFGQVHARCQHHRPDSFRVLHNVGLLKCVGWNYACDGRCVGNQLWYDFAWSLYFLDVGLWYYSFTIVFYGVFLLSWCILLWILILLSALIAMVLVLASACDGGGGDGGACDCKDCDCNCDAGNCCIDCFTAPTASGGDGFSDLMFYTFSGQPDPVAGCCDSSCGTNICHPVAWLLRLFPQHPPNMWGGLIGRFLGTHPRCSVRYTGGKWWVDKFNFGDRRDQREDLRDEGWRERVFNFITQDSGDGSADVPVQHAMSARVGTSRPSVQSRSRTDAGGLVVEVNEPFDMTRHFIVQSSFDDYSKNTCWICDPAVPDGQWDLWIQCGHMFCAGCSSEMLKRKMPCPLCRSQTISIKRGPRAYEPPVNQASRRQGVARIVRRELQQQ